MLLHLLQQTVPPELANIGALLTWIAFAGGAPYLVGKLFAYLAENWQFWLGLDTRIKFLVPMILSVLLSIGAQYALDYTELLAEINPYFQMFVAAIVAYLGTQVGYMETKKAGYGKRYVSMTRKG